MATALRWTDDEELAGRKYTGVLECLDATGDTKHAWDKDNPEEVEAARAIFAQLTKAGKYTAFKTRRNGDQGERMTTFDASAERMILIPQYAGG